MLLDQIWLNDLAHQGRIVPGNLIPPEVRDLDNLVHQGQICLNNLAHQELIDPSGPVHHQDRRAHGMVMGPLDTRVVIGPVA
ncbi:MAG: hypothetical protein Q7S71_04645 [Candidatus Nitrotoga sp.]|nr:hypothetical protein [Candidatus Nitrotoga sp.]